MAKDIRWDSPLDDVLDDPVVGPIVLKYVPDAWDYWERWGTVGFMALNLKALCVRAELGEAGEEMMSELSKYIKY